MFSRRSYSRNLLGLMKYNGEDGELLDGEDMLYSLLGRHTGGFSNNDPISDGSSSMPPLSLLSYLSHGAGSMNSDLNDSHENDMVEEHRKRVISIIRNQLYPSGDSHR